MKTFTKKLRFGIFCIVLLNIISSCGSGEMATEAPNINANSYAFGENGELFVNNGADHWAFIHTKGFPEKNVYSLDCGYTICAAVAESGIYLSNNFVSWTNYRQIYNRYNMPIKLSINLYGVITKNKDKVTSGVIAIGEGGNIINATFEPHALNSNLYNLKFELIDSPTKNDLYEIISSSDGEKYIIVGESGTVLQSTDGKNFSIMESFPTKESIYSTIYTADNKNLLTVGSDGIYKSTNEAMTAWMHVLVSPDPIFDITVKKSDNPEQTIYVATGRNNIWYSQDNASTWKKATLPNIPNIKPGNYFDIINIVYNGSYFLGNTVLVKADSKEELNINTVFISNDGINWEIRSVYSSNPQKSLQFLDWVFAGVGSLFGSIFGGDSQSAALGHDIGKKIGEIADIIIAFLY